MKIHELKTWPAYFTAVDAGHKTFEVRKDDRDFADGDVLVLREYDPDAQAYTGRELAKGVTYVFRGGDPQIEGVKAGHVVLGLESWATTVPHRIGTRVVCVRPRGRFGADGNDYMLGVVSSIEGRDKRDPARSWLYTVTLPAGGIFRGDTRNVRTSAWDSSLGGITPESLPPDGRAVGGHRPYYARSGM